MNATLTPHVHHISSGTRSSPLPFITEPRCPCRLRPFHSCLYARTVRIRCSCNRWRPRRRNSGIGRDVILILACSTWHRVHQQRYVFAGKRPPRRIHVCCRGSKLPCPACEDGPKYSFYRSMRVVPRRLLGRSGNSNP